MEYIFKRSRRKTIGITIERDGSVVLRAPLYCSRKRAEEFLYEKADWIEAARKRMLQRQAETGAVTFSEAELYAIKQKARQFLPAMVESVAKEMGEKYGRISLRFQKSRWGSCSAGGNLNFNCLLVLLPDNVRRYVVVHELCHLRELNHSRRFWAEVAKYQPTYKEDRKQLKEMGAALIDRLPG
ncbi:MAG: M48 family metallopeptidase [Lachnospiraceae bacterium]|nr:M48 family metallopeptidase [Lachnospiraceae bacterium]